MREDEEKGLLSPDGAGNYGGAVTPGGGEEAWGVQAAVEDVEDEEEDDQDEVPMSLQTNPYVLLACLVGIVLFLLLSALVMWLVERDYSGYNYLDYLYFAVVTLTTIGYGYIVPVTPAGKWLVMVNILASIVMLGYALGLIGSFLLERQERMFVRLLTESEEEEAQKRAERAQHRYRDDEAAALWWRIGISLVLLVLVLASGMLFMCLYMQWDFTNGLYFMVVTCTTVGYGDLVALDTLSRTVMIPIMLIGTFAMASSLGSLADLFVEYKQRALASRLLRRRLSAKLLARMDADHDGKVSYAEFLEYMLVKMGAVTELDIASVKEQFEKLDTDRSGHLTMDDISNM